MAMLSTSSKFTYREALKQGLRDALIGDERVFLMGEDVGHYGGSFAVSKGFLEEFGAQRIMDVPLSESGFVGAGIGASMAGLRPIVELMTVNFSLLALDQIANNAATLNHMSGGQIHVPIIIRMSCGIGRQLAGQHSHSWEPIFAGIAGLRVIAAGTHEDARGMLLGALKCNDPVVLFEYTYLLNMESELPVDSGMVDVSNAKIRKSGKDISLITYGLGVYKCLAAAEILQTFQIDAEVLDLRSLRPLDDLAIFETVRKTHRALVVEDAWKTLGIGSEVISKIMENVFYELDAPIARIAGVEVPIPYPKHLEAASVPQIEDIVNAVKKLIHHD